MSDLDRPSEFEGPYSAEEYGRCAFDHPMNWAGRCEAINADPAYCPPPDEEEE